ncbi:unnamed protein product, partial [Lampetra planeri]
PIQSKADICSKIVAEFVPQALVDQLSKYKRSLEEVDLREKQLAAMRIDICSSETLKKTERSLIKFSSSTRVNDLYVSCVIIPTCLKLTDKAGGRKFSKDFEEASTKLQEFVKFFDRQNKIGPPLLEALNNADIFYEMQYKEVKIVANAQSPPFHGLDIANPDPDLDGLAMDDDAEPPAPSPLSSPGGSPNHLASLGENDNREVEDMDLSEEEPLSGDIIGGDNMSPLTGADNQGGTPVRDEGGGTPTQDEMMDKPVGRPSSVGDTGKSAGFQYSSQKDLEHPKPQAHMQPGMSQNGQGFPPNSSAGGRA